VEIWYIQKSRRLRYNDKHKRCDLHAGLLRPGYRHTLLIFNPYCFFFLKHPFLHDPPQYYFVCSLPLLLDFMLPPRSVLDPRSSGLLPSDYYYPLRNNSEERSTHSLSCYTADMAFTLLPTVMSSNILTPLNIIYVLLTVHLDTSV